MDVDYITAMNYQGYNGLSMGNVPSKRLPFHAFCSRISVITDKRKAETKEDLLISCDSKPSTLSR